MSNIYIQEPPTNGKVLLKTTCGDLDIELWSKETPKACRNFVQLCMEGYYDGTIFHRIIKDFMAQCGDPTGTGEGGESIYGHPFKDEFHSRLRFVRRGLIAMANAGPHDNGSQFFITLGPCEHLRNKHTIFGKIAGDTLFNAMKLGEVEIGEDDRPLYPPKIKSAQVLANPFDDIEPRQLKKSKNDKEEKKAKSKSKATKNFSLLSFGEEAEENEEEISVASQAMKNKSKSMHDLVDDPRLSSVPAVEQEQESKKAGRSHPKEDKEKEEKEERRKEAKEMADRVRARLSGDKKDPKKEQESATPRDQMMSRKEELKEESRRLQKELREGKKRKEREANGKKEDNDKEENEDENKSQGQDELSEFHAQKKKFKAMKKNIAKKGSSREDQTLAMLAKFQNKLHTALLTKKPDEKTERQEEMEKKNEKEEEDGKDDGQKEDEGDIGDDWLTHSLQFENHETKVKDANVRDADTFAIYDPRNPMNKRRREDSKKKIKERR